MNRRRNLFIGLLIIGPILLALELIVPHGNNAIVPTASALLIFFGVLGLLRVKN